MVCASLLLHASSRIPGLIADLPPAKEVVVGQAAAWSIGQIPSPAEPLEDEWRGEVKGHTVIVRPSEEWPNLHSVQQGRDGSLHITRSNRQINWSTQSSIFWDGEEHVVPGHIDVYRDIRNYIGSITERCAGGAPASASDAYLVKDGF